MAMLYTHSIGNPPQNTMVVFKMSDSVHSEIYYTICNVLRKWKTSLTHIYRVYPLYDITRTKKHFKNEQRNRDDAAIKRTNTSGVGESNNYYEDIYNIPPYNNSGMLRLYKIFQQAVPPVSDLRLRCHLLNNCSLYMSTILIYLLSINIGNN